MSKPLLTTVRSSSYRPTKKVVLACPNKKIASGEVPKAHYNALYKTASPASTPEEERRYLSTASSYYTCFFFNVFSILNRTKKICGTASTDINCLVLVLYVVVVAVAILPACLPVCQPACPVRCTGNLPPDEAPSLTVHGSHTSLWSLPTKLNWAHAAAIVEGTTDLRFKAEEEQFLLRSSITIC